jgi:hypothetical protein
MRVNKNLLLQKTDQELEKYLQPNNGYVTDAIAYAAEILVSRGYVLSEAQNAYVAQILQPATPKKVHQHYITASNFILASAGVAGVGFIYNAYYQPQFSLFGGIISLLIVAGIGLLARIGTPWLKYVLLVLAVIGLFALPIMIWFYFTQPFILLINLLQTVLQIIALVFLFKAPSVKGVDIFETPTA